MDTKPLALYKLMILYMLNKVDFPLTNSQLSQFFMEKGYTGYFNVQQAITDMLDTNLIIANKIYNISYYTITHTGRDTLQEFGARISEQTIGEIDQYIDEHRYHFRNENEITADYVKTDQNNYRVVCEVRGRHELISDITLNVTSEEMAIAICDNWPEHYEEIYSFLVQKLLLRKRRRDEKEGRDT